jgi:hypothetical protein
MGGGEEEKPGRRRKPEKKLISDERSLNMYENKGTPDTIPEK